MKRRTRYSILLIGGLFFFIAAPLIVFFVGGIHYNFNSNSYTQTGILSIVSDPSKAIVTLNGKPSGTTPASVRFLQPGEYAINLSKPGYFDWSKRLQVEAGKATIVSGGLGKIYLLKRDAPVTAIADNVIDYSLVNGQLIYLTNTSVIFGDKTLPLTSLFKSLITSANGNYALLSGDDKTVFVNPGSGQIIDLTDQVAITTHLKLTDSGAVLGLRKNSLVSLDPTSKISTPLLTNVTSFTLLGNTLYYLQNFGLRTAPLSNVNASQLLLSNVEQSLSSADILVTAQKDIVLSTGTTLYKVSSALDKIADNIQQIYFDAASPTLLYATNSELDWYEFTTGKSRLITRSTQTLSSAQLSAKIGYAFFLQNNSAVAMELDDRDHQNTYQLATFTAPKKIRWDSGENRLVVLDGDVLKSFVVR